jgi:hypothetical protein
MVQHLKSDTFFDVLYVMYGTLNVTSDVMSYYHGYILVLQAKNIF